MIRSAGHESRSFTGLDGFVQDVRYGARLLLRGPGMSLVAVLTLALGIGATTSLFAVVNAALLRSLPYPDADRLVVVRETMPGGAFGGVSYPDFVDWKTRNTVFDSIAAYSQFVTYNMQAGDRTERISGEIVSAEYFSMLGAQPVRGRLLRPEETSTPGDAPVAVISYSLWQREFGGDSAIIGRRLVLNEAPFTVVGVASAGFLGIGGSGEIWTPITMYPILFPQNAKFDFLHSRGTHWHRVLGHVKPGVTIEQARAEMKRLGDQLAAEYPKDNLGRSAGLRPLPEDLRGRVETPLWLLLGAVAIVLLVACANVANLLLARTVSRERELAVRAALGAGRSRLLRQLLTESLLLSLLGGITGAAFAAWARGALTPLLPVALPAFAHVDASAAVVAFSLLATLLVALLVGLGPARRAASSRAEAALRSGSRSKTGRHARRVINALAACQIALAMVLLAGAGLLARTLSAMERIDLGFKPDHLALIRFDVPNQSYTGEKRQRMPEELAVSVRSMPEVSSAAVTYIDPFLWSGINRGFTIEGRPENRSDWDNTLYVEAGPDFFRTMGVSMREGRDFNQFDTPTSERVLIVSESFARRYWPRESAVGKHMTFGERDEKHPWMTVVGVAGDFEFESLTGDPHPPVFYAPAMQGEGVVSFELVVRTKGSPANLLPALTERVRDFDRGLPLYHIATMEERLSGERATTRSFTLLLGLFAGSTLLLAGLGVYGVLASAVGERVQELGVRLALGATRADLLRVVLRQSLLLAAAGTAGGIVAALVLTRWMGSLLYGVGAADPLAFAAATAAVLVLALAACALPAWRATRVDPIVVLRYE
jgi:putative ABC transport system permease protein